jgi:hypothetical protein
VSAQTIDIHLPKTKASHINNQQEDWSFRFDHVLDNASQEAVYDTTSRCALLAAACFMLQRD